MHGKQISPEISSLVHSGIEIANYSIDSQASKATTRNCLTARFKPIVPEYRNAAGYHWQANSTIVATSKRASSLYSLGASLVFLLRQSLQKPPAR